ncbi:MAG: hypothetical protein ACREN6_17735 [Gemmatimonadaceae bacterium]
MTDNLDPRDETHKELSAPRKTPEVESSAADREMPPAHTADAIHAWLDGENVNESALHAAEKEYEFWRRVEKETGKRRRMKTPSPLAGEIMRAIKKD